MIKKCDQCGADIAPGAAFCTNCGSKEFTVEKLDKINFIDINFAVLQKKVVEEDLKVNTTQCWQERTNGQPKLLVQYL